MCAGLDFETLKGDPPVHAAVAGVNLYVLKSTLGEAADVVRFRQLTSGMS